MRISLVASDLSEQLRFAAAAAASVPGWAGPTPVELEALADSAEASDQEVRRLMMELKVARSKLAQDVEAGRESMRRVDDLTTALYGKGGAQKAEFGLKPEDIVRNRAPVPDAPFGLTLADEAGGLMARWKGTRRATYEVQCYFDPELERLAGGVVSTRQKAIITGFPAGTELFIRVRASRSGRFSGWSETVRRFVNG